MPDRRGSGLNSASRGDTTTLTRWLADIDEIMDAVEKSHNIQRWAIVGVSWGGKLAVAWQLWSSRSCDRLLLIAPGIAPAVDVRIWKKLQIALALLVRPTHRFEIPLSDPALFTSNPDGQTFIRTDDLKLTHATARFLFRSTQLDWLIKKAKPKAVSAPIDLVFAEKDRIIDNAKTMAIIADLADRNCIVDTFSAADHTLEFDTDASEFDNFLRRWAFTAKRSDPIITSE